MKKIRFYNPVILTTHSTKSGLQKLLPNAKIAGGSFSKELPCPDRLSATEARSRLRAARNEARKVALSDLEDSLGCEESPPIKKSSEGFRTWPDGFTGSVTHKAAIILSAAVESSSTESLGIDLEYDCEGGKGLAHAVNKGEIPDHADSKPTALGVFSTKESVYKSYYPITQAELDFGDIHIKWLDSSPSVDYGIARGPDSVEFKVQCLYLKGWVVSTSQLIDVN